MRGSTRAILLGMGLLVASLAASAQQVFTVACAAGETINAALARGDSRKPVTIQVNGTCTENVVIARDDLTLSGNWGGVSAADPSRPTIWVQGTRVIVIGFTVTGGSHAIEVSGGNAVTVQNVELRGATANGLYVVNGAAVLINSRIEGNGGAGIFLRDASVRVSGTEILGNQGPGIEAVRNSAASSYDNTIRNNAEGILIDTGSTVIMSGGTVGPGPDHGLELATHSNANLTDVTIINNGAGGVLLDAGSTAVISGGTIGPNGGSGLALASNSTAKLTNVTIEDNGKVNGESGVVLDTGSTATISGGAIRLNAGGGIVLASNSTARLTDVALAQNGIQNYNHGINASFSQISIQGGSITQSAGRGIDLFASRADVSQATVDNNARDGIRGRIASTVLLDGGSARNNGGNGVNMQLNSTLQASNPGTGAPVVTGNGAAGIVLEQASVLSGSYVYTRSNSGSYDLDCRDAESSYRITGTDGRVAEACTAF